MKPHRIPLHDFPDVELHASESAVKAIRSKAAKTGDAVAAAALIAKSIDAQAVQRLATLMRGRAVELVPIHPLESEGVNEIPAAMAEELSRRLRLTVHDSIVQLNSVGHTGADGFTGLANQALFEGPVRRGQAHCVVDDFVGQGGTLANLIGFIHSQGGGVLGADGLDREALPGKAGPRGGPYTGTESETWCRA